PVSLVGTFVFFPLFGFSVNTISLLGLVLAIGLVVDGAIVVVEAVEHHIEQGLSPRGATLRATSEVSASVVATALSLAAAFLPTAWGAGVPGRPCRRAAGPIAVAAPRSPCIAVTLAPALAAKLLMPRRATRGPLGGFSRGFVRAYGPLP